MQPSARPFPWQSITITLLLLLGFILLTTTTAILVITGLLTALQDYEYEAAAAILIISVGAGLGALLLLPGIYFNGRLLLGKTSEEENNQLKISAWAPPVLALLWIAAIFAGQWLAHQTSSSWITLPLLSTAAVLPPLIILARLAANRINLGPRWQTWGAFGVSAIAGPVLAAIVEVIILVVVFLIAVVFIAADPELMTAIEKLSVEINYAADEEILSMLEPYLVNPLLVVGLLSILSLAIPLIEEALKPIGLLLLVNKVKDPQTGFVLGTLSGAGFAFFENYSSLASAGADWGFQAAMRGGAAVLHMTASGLVGWGIIAAWKERSISRLLINYGIAVVFHGLWNATAIGLGFGALANKFGFGSGRILPHLEIAATIFLCFLVVTGILTIITTNSRYSSREGSPGTEIDQSMVR